MRTDFILITFMDVNESSIFDNLQFI